jgi:hypothetical protein
VETETRRPLCFLCLLLFIFFVFYPCFIGGRSLALSASDEPQRLRASLRSSANSAVQSGELSAWRWIRSGAHSLFPSESGDFLVPYFLVILRLRPKAGPVISWLLVVRL